MTTLDDVLRSLLDPGSPWQTRQARCDWNLWLRYRQAEMDDGLHLAYEPAGEFGPAATLTLWRPKTAPTADDVQAVANALARVLGRPGMQFVVTDRLEQQPARRLWWPPSPLVGVRAQTYQATIYDLDERYEWNWQVMAEGSDRAAVAQEGWEAAGGLVIMKVEVKEDL
jgi:hypothetical protein